MRRILILGGTTEARQLASRLAGRDNLDVTLSLAGRTSTPAAQPVPVRTGGFGGVVGLASYLQDNCIDLLIDATHPYAATMAHHAAAAATQAGVTILAIRRPPWSPAAADQWIHVEDIAGAIRALGEPPKRVFLAIGRKEVGAFAAAPQHSYVIRSVDPIDPQPMIPHATYILARGPFAEADEKSLLSGNRIEFVVAKNSGGGATYGKISAARVLGIKVIMLRRPRLPAVPAVETVSDAIRWLDHASVS